MRTLFFVASFLAFFLGQQYPLATSLKDHGSHDSESICTSNLSQNIATYTREYLSWNTRKNTDISLEYIYELERKENAGLKISEEETQQFNEKAKRSINGGNAYPLRMVISEAVQTDAKFTDGNGACDIGKAACRDETHNKRIATRNDVGTDPLDMVLPDAVQMKREIENGNGASGKNSETGIQTGPNPLKMVILGAGQTDVEFVGADEARDERFIDFPQPLKMVIADAVQADAKFDDGKEPRSKRNVNGNPSVPKPLRMVISDAGQTGAEFVGADEARDERFIDFPQPLKMVIADAVQADAKFDDEKEALSRRDVIGTQTSSNPLRMVISDAVQTDAEFVDGDEARNERFIDFPQPLKMVIADAFQADAKFDDGKEAHSRRDVIGTQTGPSKPLRMVISDAGQTDNTFYDGDVVRDKKSLSEIQDIPLPLKMVIADAAQTDGEFYDIDETRDKRSTDGIRDVGLQEGKQHSNSNNQLRMCKHDKTNNGNQENTTYEETPKQKKLKNAHCSLNAEINSNKEFTSTHDKFASCKFMYENGSYVMKNSWHNIVRSLHSKIPEKSTEFFCQWGNIIKLFRKKGPSSLQFANCFPQMPERAAIEHISRTNSISKLYWPFVYDIGFMNQKLGLLGFTGDEIPRNQQKTAFYKALEKHQTINIPVVEKAVVYSFDDSNVVDGLNRSGLVEYSKEFVAKGHHLIQSHKRPEIISKVDAAMGLINKTMPELYNAINQLVACFAFYKAEQHGYIGGTVSSALGIIWLDTDAMDIISIPFIAEQIVHEFIHTSLFYAELVHGSYTNHQNLKKAKVTSSIRRELRDYDKSFHAAYVSTGLIAFHARAGYLKRAESLASPLLSTVDELVEVNNKTGILNSSGEAMLQAMLDFLIVGRLKK